MTLDHTEWLEAFFDQELDPIQHQAFEQHLITCDRCRVNLDTQAVLRRKLRSLPDIVSAKSNQRFLTEVKLMAQRRDSKPLHTYSANVFGYLIPLSLLLTLIAVQIYGWFIGIVGLIPGANQFIISNISAVFTSSYGLSSVFSLFSFDLRLFGIGSLFRWNLINQITAVAALAVLYVVWMGLWFLKNQRQVIKPRID